MEIMSLAIAVFAVIIGLVIGYVSISAKMKSSQEAAELMLLNAEQEGVKFNWLSVPSKLITENKLASSLSYKIATLGEADETGRRKPIDRDLLFLFQQ